MTRPLLIVLLAAPRTTDECGVLLRRLRRLTHDSPHHALLLCDLPDAPIPKTGEDDAMLRTLQSGVMSMERHSPGRYRLLVRSRVYDDAARMYLGAGQPQDPRQTAAALICTGRTDLRFDAVSRAPESLLDSCCAALFIRDDAVCTPDTPQRMLSHLQVCGTDCIAGRVLFPAGRDTPLIARLLRTGFSFSARRHAQQFRLQRSGMTLAGASPALLAGMDGLTAIASCGLPRSCPVAQDCLFLCSACPTPAHLLDRQARRCAHVLRPQNRDPGDRLDAAIPLLAFLLLLAGFSSGRMLPAAAALIYSERSALRYPQLLPGALVRLCLLPLRAAVSADALFKRLLAKSPLRIELTPFFFGAGFCAASSAVVLLCAAPGAHALAPAMALSLLWLSTPLLIPALSSPVLERIPLSDRELSALTSMARQACLAPAQDAPAPQRMLTACAACMLGLLEADEAARRAEHLLETIPQDACFSSADAACAFAAAQYLRERMTDCDAALRPLPARIEQRFLRVQAYPSDERLDPVIARVLRVPLRTIQAAPPLHLSGVSAIFLPERLLTEEEAVPLTHPHAFLQEPDALPGGVCGALLLTEAALDRPFLSLLQRSPAVGPFTPILFIETAGAS